MLTAEPKLVKKDKQDFRAHLWARLLKLQDSLVISVILKIYDSCDCCICAKQTDWEQIPAHNNKQALELGSG